MGQEAPDSAFLDDWSCSIQARAICVIGMPGSARGLPEWNKGSQPIALKRNSASSIGEFEPITGGTSSKMKYPQMDLQQKIRTLPASAGVYLYKNAEGDIIYVGKANNLRSRVSSYFHEGRHIG